MHRSAGFHGRLGMGLLAAALAGCAGSASVVVFDADDRCPAGGVELTVDGEVTVVCNGAAGVDGVAGAAGAAGSDGQDGVAAPVIATLSATGLPAAPEGQFGVHVEARVANGATPTYTWSASAGWSVASGQGSAEVTINAPDEARASGSVTVRVGDGSGMEAVGVITVSTAASDLPIIHSVHISPQPIRDVGTLNVVADDAGGGSLTARWNIGGIDIADGMSASWPHPGIPGLYEGRVTVTDADGHEATATFPVQLGSDSAWPVEGATLQSTNRQDREAPPAEGAVVWSYAGPYMQNAAVLDDDGNLYVGSWNPGTDEDPTGFVVSLTPSGTQRWKRSMSPGLTEDGGYSDVYGAPVLANGRVYWSDWAGHLFAADPATGVSDWEFFTGDYNDNSSPIVAADGTIYVGSSLPTGLFAVNPDGTEKWHFDLSTEVITDPAIAPDGTIIFADDATLWAVRPDGTERWHRPIEGQSYMNFAIAPNGTVYCSTASSIVAYDREGVKVWEVGTWASTRGLALAKDGTVYGVEATGVLRAIYPSGLDRWTFTGSDFGWGSAWTTPAIGSDGTIYFVAGDTVYAVNPEGVELWSAPLLDSAHTSGQISIGSDGTLYVGANDGVVYAIE